MRVRWISAAALALALGGCGSSDIASFMVDGRDTAVTLERIKPYAWSDAWELQLVVRRHPDCQRRHTLKPAAEEALKVELFSPEPNVFILRQGKRWYVTEMRACQLQAFKEPPPQPGAPVGAFQVKGGKFAFVGEQAAKPAAPR